jgi:peroxiredoxin
MKKIIILLLFCLSFGFVKAQKTLKAGDKVENIKLLNVDDKIYSLNEQAGAKGFILVFMSNNCEYCIMYKDRIVALDNKYKSLGYPVVGVAPYGDDPIKFPLDAMPEMKKWHKAKNIKFPYVTDNQFKYTNLFGIKMTPTVVLLQKQKSDYIIKYIGKIDDNAELKKDKTVKSAEIEINKLLKKK